MNLSLRLSDPTNCFLVAFDIVSSSQNLNNPNGLARDREQLVDAINQTKLVRQGAINKSIVGQFLGDEFRIAIPSTHDDQSVKPSRILEFIDEVFLTLDAPQLGYAPVIRAALTQGALRSKELKNVCYLCGESLLKLSDVLSAIDGKDNLLISTVDLSGLQKESVNGEPLYVKRYARRLIPNPYDGSKAHDLANFFLVGVTNARTIGKEDGKLMVQRDVHQTLLDFSRICLEGFDPVRITISPSSIVFVFRESSFKASKEFLNTVRSKAGIYESTLQLAAAIAYGPGLEIPEKDWLAETFESGTAIKLCRLLSKLPAGSLAMPDDPEYTELFSPLSRSINDEMSLPGKRNEVFKCRILRTYFPIKTASMPSDYQLVSDQDHTATKTTPLPVEPDTFSVAIEALVSLLQSDSTLLNALVDATNEKEKGTLQTPLTTAEDLVRWILSSSFPLLRFGEIIGDLHLTNKRLSHDSAKKNLHICKAYFRIASLPVDDKKVVYFALQNAFFVSGKSQEGASKSIQTANKHFAEDLLISTWIQISQRSLEISEIYKLIHREPISGNPITDADRLVFATVRILSQPTDPDTSSKLSVWFAKCCWQELMGTSVMPDDPIGAVNNYIGRMAKLKAATAMYIAKDRSEAIQEIKNTFPQLVLIPLSDTDAKRYADISTEMSIVEKLIDQICRS